MSGWPSLLAGLGSVALGFGLLSALMLVFQPVSDPLWVLGNLILGLVLLVTSAVASIDTLRERMASGEGRRVRIYGSSAVAGTTLALAILAMLAFLSTRYSTTFDWTEAQVHTLTDQSLKLLGELDQDVAFTAFFNELDAPPVRDLLKRYDRASERVSLIFVDPNYRPDLVVSMELPEEELARGLVRVEVGDASLDLGEFSEMEVTNAILKLTRSGDHKVYFVEGHNERFIDAEQGGDKEGYLRAAEALRNETYQVETLVLATVAEVPEDANAVILAGPTRPYMDEEHAVLARYVNRGGSLMVLVDPRAQTDLYDDLLAWGVEVGDDVLVDQSLALFGKATSPFAGAYAPEHPITQDLREQTLFPMVRSVQGGEGFESIVYTGEQSWAERDIESWIATGKAVFDDADLPGPVSIAVAGAPRIEGAEEGVAAGRMVVFGDSDFATNEFIDVFRNRDLFVNSVNWLLGDDDLISLRPHVTRASRFQLSADEARRIQILSLFVLPEAIAVVGVLAWWSRRRESGQ